MQLTQIQRVSGNILKLIRKRIKSGSGSFKNNSGRISFRVGNVFVAHGMQDAAGWHVN